jgi:GDP-4-dehydro-6-deoxy-D-mannose reductase
VPTRVVVTGAAGFAGSHLVERLARAGVTIGAWSHTPRTPPVPTDAQWSAVDLLDRDAVDRAVAAAAPDVVYHCAGMAQTAGAADRIGATFAANVRGTANLFDAVARHAPRARVLVTSSALVYRRTAEVLTEDAPLGPAGPYAVSKLAQDMLARRAASDGLDVVVARPFNHIGPRQSADFVASSVARQVALIEQGRMPAILHVGNLSARRDFTDVRDVVAAYAALADAATAGECVNVCSGHAVAIADLVHGLVQRSRVPIEVVVDPARVRPVDVPVVVGSAGRLAALTGWAPQVLLDQTLDDLLSWWRANAR